MKRGVTALKGIYTALLMIFMYAPIIAMIVLSFNASKSRAVWGGFTLHWYRSLFHDRPILSSFYNTIIIALIAAVIATIVGTLAAIGITRMRTFMRTTSMAVTNIPMLNADIVTGIAMMLLFIACRMTLGFATVLIAHITFCIPYVILSVLPKLSQARRSTYEAALDLGATPLTALFEIVIPQIVPGIVSGFALAITLSLDDYFISTYTKPAMFDTISTYTSAQGYSGSRRRTARYN